MKDSSRRRSRSPKYGGTAGGSDWYDSNGRNSSAMGDGHEEGYRLHVADLHTKARMKSTFLYLFDSDITTELTRGRGFESISCFCLGHQKGPREDLWQVRTPARDLDGEDDSLLRLRCVQVQG